MIATSPAALYRDAFARFSLGERERAFAGLHQRSTIARFRPPELRDLPCWEGEEGRDVLIWAPEGIGIGAEILHLGFLPALAAARPRLTLLCDRRLARRLARALPGLCVVARGDAPPEGLEAQASILSLGHLAARVLGAPRRGSRLFGASRARAQALRARLSPDGEPLIGLSWMTTNARWGQARDLPEPVVLGLLADRGLRFVDLQHGAPAAQRARLAAAGLVHEPEFDPVADFDGLLDRVAAMDAVVTIDNSLAYAAGALGKPGLVVLGAAHSWPWDAPDGYWYRSLATVPAKAGEDAAVQAAAIAARLRALPGLAGRLG